MSRSSSLVVVVRLVVLLVAAGAVVTAFAVRRGCDAVVPSSGASYVCPMHPRITAHSPGQCPICGMALEPAAARTSSGSTTVDASNGRRFDTVRRRIFSQELYAPAWIESGGLVAAIVYNDELGGLASGETASFLPAQAPSAGVDVCLAAEPPEPWDRATARARFQVVAGASSVPPGTVGWVRLPSKAREVLVVPSSAILDSPQGPYVLSVETQESEPERQPVVIGKVIFGVTTVVSGVREGERVVARNAFFLDAERRLHGEPSP